jgi:hypothetical protein
VNYYADAALKAETDAIWALCTATLPI